ncbi:hypothetical protein CHUUTOTORO_01790 [Serratia phage vB_SmaM-ChuuTotoro]|nr:hypothetical protein CHUUTOTORO_01790 [Serratia phage vB_SmaM-ChuuTotoro]
MSKKKHTVRIDWKKQIVIACVFAALINHFGEKTPPPVDQKPKVLHITD